jgi:hypothetical protein
MEQAVANSATKAAGAVAATATPVTVRVIAVGGKFLGDDVAGALVGIRDIQTGELLASGRTFGGSGPSAVMNKAILRTQPIPTVDPGDPANDAARFDATLLLDRPRWVEVSAIGPLVAPTPARVVKTIWLYPGKSLSPGDGQREDGLLLEIPGLLVGILAPPAHYLPDAQQSTQPIVIRANVTMMCGCPIDTGGFWPPTDFEVTAYIEHSGQHTTVPLHFVPENEIGAPSQFASKPWTPGGSGIFNIDVVAYQKSTGNLGVARTSVIMPAGKAK